MADYIELTCNSCGKNLKVPKSRAGQTGKCARCGSAVFIPVLNSQVGASPVAESGPVVKSPTQSLNFQARQDSSASAFPPSTALNSSPLSNPPSNIVSSYTAMATSSNPLNNPPSSSNLGYYTQQPAFTGAKPMQDETQNINNAPADIGFPNAPTATNYDPVGRKNTTNRYNALSPAALAPPIQVSQPAPPPVAVTNTNRKKSAPSWLTPTIFVSGLLLGILIGQLLPWNLLAWLRKDSSIDELEKKLLIDKEALDNPTTSPTDKTPEIEMPSNNTPETSKPKDDPLINEKKLRLEENLKGSKAYLGVISENSRSLRQKMDKMSIQYNLAPAEKNDELLGKAGKQSKYVDECIKYGEQVQKKQMWHLLDRANEYLKSFQTDANKTALVQQLQETEKEIDAQLKKFNAATAAPTTSVSENEVMGAWYKTLIGSLDRLDNLLGQNFRTANNGANVRLDVVRTEIRKIRGFGRDIATTASDLKKLIDAGKDPNEWIRERRTTADTRSKQEQADVLERFLKSKKFNISIQSLQEDLDRAIKTLGGQIKSTVTEDTAKELLKPLKGIDGKFQEEYQSFNSAVINFSAK